MLELRTITIENKRILIVGFNVGYAGRFVNGPGISLYNFCKILSKNSVKYICSSCLDPRHFRNDINYVGFQGLSFIKDKNFSIDIEIFEDGKEILNTGGGILNLMSNSQDDDYLIFNPDTLWNEYYVSEINKMQSLYFSNQLSNILLVANKDLSYDKNLNGDFGFKNNLLNKNLNKNFIYTGCQILNKDLFNKYGVKNFSISEVWNELLKKDKLNGFESFNKFYHLTNLEIFKKLKDF